MLHCGFLIPVCVPTKPKPRRLVPMLQMSQSFDYLGVQCALKPTVPTGTMTFPQRAALGIGSFLLLLQGIIIPVEESGRHYLTFSAWLYIRPEIEIVWDVVFVSLILTVAVAGLVYVFLAPKKEPEGEPLWKS